MSKFMVLYRAPLSAREQMASATPEQMQAGLEAWQAWAAKVSYAIVDLGSPLAHTTHVGPGAASDPRHPQTFARIPLSMTLTFDS